MSMIEGSLSKESTAIALLPFSNSIGFDPDLMKNAYDPFGVLDFGELPHPKEPAGRNRDTEKNQRCLSLRDCNPKKSRAEHEFR